jgi:membrane protein
LLSLTLRRAREERLVQAAGSLTFTTVLSLAPLLAASFALFMRVPALRRIGVAIQGHLLAGLLPPELARTVLKYLGRFAANANGLTWIGSLLVLASALALLFTVEATFNRIWQVRKERPPLRRVGLYFLLLLLGPPALGASLWATSYVLGASAGLVAGLPPRAALLLNLAPVVLGTAGFACLFRFVPNAPVRWRDAIAGGLLAGIAFELGKRSFAAYLLQAPTYRAVYGAFAALPVFLLWVYFSWLVTLGAALVAAGLGRGRRQPGRRLSRA